MKNWTIGKRLTVGFCAVIAIAAALGGYAATRIVQIRNVSASVTEDSLPGIISIDKVVALTSVNEGLLLHHMSSDSQQMVASIDKELEANDKLIDAALTEYEATIKTDKDRALFAAIKGPRAEVLDIRTNKIMPLSRAFKNKEALAVYERELMPAADRCRKALQAEVDLNTTDGLSASKDIDATVSSSIWLTMAGIALTIAIGGLAAWYVTSTTNRALRSSVSELTSGAQQVVAASGQVSTSAQSLSQGATEQAASLEETSASMEEMASMTRKNAENSQSAATLMGEVDQRVRESNIALGDMVTSMAAIRESSQQVAKIIKTIDEIAFQTNILALNAAVEAARAGEAGMGFAVVADEVRNLAQRSAQAAKDTASLIEQSIDRAQRGNVKVEQVSGAISGITESVTRVKGLVEEVSVASRQQTQGIDQVSQAIAQMEKVTQSTAATAEESAAASEELNAQAEASMGVVARLEALVDKTSSASAVRRPAHKGSKVVRLAAAKPARAVRTMQQAEDELPLSDTGTFGRF